MAGSFFIEMRMIAPPPPVATRSLAMFDIELYVNYLLLKFYDPVTGEFFAVVLNLWTPLDRQRLITLLLKYTIVTFNGNKYDIPILACVLAGFTNAQLKAVSNAIINGNMQPWQVEQEFGVTIPDFIDHIDLIEVLPGKASLKSYGGKLHCKKIQDLPIPHDAVLTPDEMTIIDTYCSNDLVTTWAQYCKFKSEIELRIEMSKEYGIDLRSKSDAQIAEAIFKKQLPNKVYPPHIPPGTQFFYKKPDFIKFRTPELQAVLAMILRSPFTIGLNGSPEMTSELENCAIKVGTSMYQLGMGGLHSCEKNASHIARDGYTLLDVDVISYYPKIISILRMFPPQIGEIFLTIFEGWIDDRIAAKIAGIIKKANSAKTKINGTFGKTGSKYSILNAPSMMIQTTITGQLGLLMQIEMHVLAGIEIVSANTDGIVIKCHKSMHHIRDAITANWENITGFKTEAVEYRALFSRDVNSYIAFKMDGKTKRKGAFAPPEPVGPSWPNPANEICVLAAIEYINNGTSIEQTIRQCADIRQFVTVRNATGGGEWQQGTMPDPKATMATKRLTVAAHGWAAVDKTVWIRGTARATLDDAYRSCFQITHRQYLGKTVRWYYSRGQSGHIAYTSNGNKVARSDGCRPCMELPDVLPPDIDYDWYIRETKDLLVDLNCC